jgi:hypothetical protein
LLEKPLKKRRLEVQTAFLSAMKKKNLKKP